MFRLILCFLVLLIAFVLTIIAFPLSRLIFLFNKRAGDVFSLKFVMAVFKALLFVSGVKVTVKGRENLPEPDEGVVYISNHLGIFDVVSLYPLLPGRAGFIAKKEIKTWPLIGWWLIVLNCLFLDRQNTRNALKTILKGIENVENGISMVIFPEGTRSRVDGDLLPFHDGSFKLATKPKARIIPVAITNSAAVFENHLPWIKSAEIVIEFLKPIETASLSRDELKALPSSVHDLIQERVRANHPKGTK